MRFPCDLILLTLLISFVASLAGRSNSPTTRQNLVGNMGPASAVAPAACPASSSSSVVKVSEDIVKPACDKLSYRVVQLQNNLRVLLVHDPDTEKAAAALDVRLDSGPRMEQRHQCGEAPCVVAWVPKHHLQVLLGVLVALRLHALCPACCVSLQVRVGSMCDPAHLPGLAHFCEHMLFYSSQKYPVEDEYSK